MRTWGHGILDVPDGALAQLGERFHGMEEVIGSIPISSTKQGPPQGGPSTFENT
jgi:hypothetical protein